VGGHLTLEERGSLAIVTLDRPPANALDPELLEESGSFVEDLRAREPGAVVITGRPGFFSAGVDLKKVPSLDAEGQRAMVDGINRLFAGWYSFPRPVVCAVNGHAVAGGMILALCGDYRVGSTEGKLGLTELRVGFPYPTAAIAVVRAELTPAAARVLVLRAELIGPTTALDMGALDELAEPNRVLPRALEVAEEMAALPRDAYPLVKRQLRGETIDLVTAVAEGRADPVAQGWLSGDTAAASAAMLQR
jgi:enoyl-CoA hydratase/carnithine racemase